MQTEECRKRISFFKLRTFTFFCLLQSALCIVVHAADYRQVDVPRSGIVEGLVKFPGEAPSSIMFGNRADPACPRGIPQGNLFVEARHRGIKNVLIVLSVEEGKPIVHGARADLILNQCSLAPRVAAL